MTSLAQDLVDLENTVKQGAQEVKDMKVAAVESVVTPVTERTTRMQSRVDGISAKATTASERLATTAAGLAQVREQLPLTIDLASIAATLVLAWLILAQVSLLVHARDHLRTPAPATLAPAESSRAAGSRGLSPLAVGSRQAARLAPPGWQPPELQSAWYMGSCRFGSSPFRPWLMKREALLEQPADHQHESEHGHWNAETSADHRD